MAFSRAAFLSSSWWSRMVSIIWLPTVCTGLNEVIGSWKISAMSPPRTSRISRLSASRRARSLSRPSRSRSRISPLTTRPGRSTMRRIERAVTLLPHPLSPTMPRVLPA